MLSQSTLHVLLILITCSGGVQGELIVLLASGSVVKVHVAIYIA